MTAAVLRSTILESVALMDGAAVDDPDTMLLGRDSLDLQDLAFRLEKLLGVRLPHDELRGLVSLEQVVAKVMEVGR
jgi:acyl carrier protein